MNLLGAVNVPIVIVGADLRIRRFTSMAERLFNLLPGDIGRPIANINPAFKCPELVPLLRGTIETVDPVEREVQGEDGRFYILRIRPYKDLDCRIDGAVIALFDISDLRQGMVEARAARDYAEGIVETIREPLLVLNAQLRIQSANRSFFEIFHVLPSETEGKLLYELGNGQRDIPDLRKLLEELLPERRRLDNFLVEHDFPTIGRKTMLLNARRIERKDCEAILILLAIEDVTGQARNR